MPELDNGADVIGYSIGLLIGMVIDVVSAVVIFAIPLAALVVLGLIGQGVAYAILAGVAVLAALRVLLVGMWRLERSPQL